MAPFTPEAARSARACPFTRPALVRLSAPLSAPAKLPGRPGFDFRNKGDIQNPDAIAQKTIELLDTPAVRHAMRKRAYLFAREMVWKNVAQGYMASFVRVRGDRAEHPRQIGSKNREDEHEHEPLDGVGSGGCWMDDKTAGQPPPEHADPDDLRGCSGGSEWLNDQGRRDAE